MPTVVWSGHASSMNPRTESCPFKPVRVAARHLGVPIAWLEREAKLNRIPAVRAGRRWLIHLEKTEQRLLERAELGDVPLEHGVSVEE